MAIPAYMASTDLDDLVGAALVTQLSNDDGSPTRNEDRINSVLCRAEARAYAILERGWPSEDSVKKLVSNDPDLKGHVGWVALQYLSERKSQFSAVDGSGRFKTQFDRAIKAMDDLSKSKLASKGESKAGKNKQTGGRIQPRIAGATVPPLFAPSSSRPRGPGRF